ncbi:MAG: hypothetical protein OXE50_02260 [Chloroflexi bacterium]|nr:hypothetical protein [Chloroflexota bacterium]
MVDQRITDLPDAAALSRPNLIEVVQGDANVKATLAAILTFLEATLNADAILPEHEQAETLALFSRAGALFWRLVNEVPSTPGTASGIGRALVVTGENDRDYRWRAAQDWLALAVGGGLRFSNDGRLETSPSLVSTAARADENTQILAGLVNRVDGIETAAEAALARTQRLRPVSVWLRNREARTLYFEWFPNAALPADANLSFTIGGTPVRNVDPVGGGLPALSDTPALLPVPINAASATNITNSSNARAGYIEAQLEHGGLRDSCWMRVVEP